MKTRQHEDEVEGEVIAVGDPAPDFRLPGRRGSDARLFHLDEHVRRGSVLLVFARMGYTGSGLEELLNVSSWFEFDGIGVWLVTDGPRSRPVGPSANATSGVAILSDVDGSVAERYGVQYEDEETKTAEDMDVVLADRSRTVRFARRTDLLSEPETIAELRRTIERTRSRQHQETPA